MPSHLNDIIVCGNSLKIMFMLPDSCIDLMINDPPYFKIRKEWWDRQWDTVDGYIEWFDKVCQQWYRLLKPSGSLYVFASPKMAARIEIKIGEYFNVLNRITWSKPKNRFPHSQILPKSKWRQYRPWSEIIIFAEHRDSQRILRNIRLEHGTSSNEAALLFPSKSGGITGCVRNWELNKNTPSIEQYSKLGTLYPLPPYEDVIRPFTVTIQDQYTDVWEFPTVRTYPGKHPCEKPLAMIEHIVKVSSRHGDLVADFFCGSGTTAEAAINLNRRYFCCDVEERWARRAKQRVAQRQLAFSVQTDSF